MARFCFNKNASGNIPRYKFLNKKAANLHGEFYLLVFQIQSLITRNFDSAGLGKYKVSEMGMEESGKLVHLSFY